MEREVVEMALDLFQAPEGGGGGMTTGGTKSIFMAVRACREWAREAKGRQGLFNIVAAESAHPAFDKAGVRIDIPVKQIPLRDNFRAVPAAMAAAIDYDTMMMVDGYVAGIEAIDGLKMHAKPDVIIINFGSDEVDIFRVAEVMAESG